MRVESSRAEDARQAQAATPSASQAKEPEKKKRGFWSRLFGRGNDDDDKEKKEKEKQKKNRPDQ